MKKHYAVLFLITFVFASQVKAQVTTYNDVASIFYKRCSYCHHNGGIAPMPLMSFSDASAWSSSIDTYVRNNSMPPWSPDTSYTRFLHERVMTAPEKAAILKWVADNAVEGDPTLAPTPPVYADYKYELCPEPTVTLRIPTFNSNSDANNTDPYDCFSVPTNLTKDRWLRAFEIIPGDKSIVHHVVITVDTAKNKAASNLSGNCTNQAGQFGIGGWSAGSAAVVFPGKAPMKAGIRIPKGSNLVLQIHYAPGSGGKVDSTGIRMYYYPEGETGIRPVYSDTWLYNWLMNIPANDSVTYTASKSISSNISLFSTSPHSHNVCTRIINYADKSGSPLIPIIKIKSWDYNWQGNYYYPKLLKIPSGYTIQSSHFYNNTTSNPHDKTPNKAVTAGKQTSQEMLFDSFQWLDYQTGDENIDIAALLKCDTLLVCKPVAAGIITGSKTICLGKTGVSYSVPLIDNAATYTWAYSGNGATIYGNGDSITVDFSANATAGNLTVMGVNSCGISGPVSAKYAISFGAGASVGAAGSITGTASVCKGQSSVSYSVPSISGASSYIWAYSGTGVTITGTTNSVTVSFSSNATSGNLTVKGSSACGDGVVSANYAVTVNEVPTTPVISVVNNCGSSDLTSTSTTGTYLWSPGGATTQTITVTTGGTYSVTVSTGGNCSATSAGAVITINNSPTAVISGGATVCKGNTGVLSIALSGKAPWAFSYGTSAGSNAVTNITTSTYTVAAGAGTYTVANITDGSGCSGTTSGSAIITERSAIVVSNVLTVCNSNNSSYTVEFDISGGDAGSYLVTGGTGNRSGSHFTSASINSGGSYAFSVSDVNNCTPVTVNGSKNCNCGASAVMSGDGKVCGGSTASISIALSGTSPWKFTYAINGVNQPEVTGQVNSTYTFTTTTVGVYTLVSVTDASCTGSTSGTATVSQSLPTVGATVSLDATVCTGTSVTFNGTGAVNYTWSDGIVNGQAFTATASKTYTVTGVDANNCSNTATLAVTVLPAPNVSTVVSPSSAAVCAGDSIVLSGVGAVSYKWTGGKSDGVAFAAVSSETFTVTGTDANNCSGKATRKVTVFPAPKVGVVVSPADTVCSGASVTLTGTGASNYAWSDGITDGSPFMITSSNTFTVVGTDANSCSTTSSKTITVISCNRVGIKEINSSAQEITVYPNPNNGLFNINVKNANFKEVSIVVVNMLGKEVFSASDKNNSTEYHVEFNLENVSKGLYYLKLSTGTELLVKKLMIQ
jgi:Secretion system C-terminal sorting domain/PKD-like domain